MADLAVAQIARITYEATVLRSVPCSAHGAFHAGCPNCLTGEQAHALGIAPVEHLGVVADTETLLPLTGTLAAAAIKARDGMRRLFPRPR